MNTILRALHYLTRSPVSSHSSTEQHDHVGGSGLHAPPAGQHAAQPSGNQHHQHAQWKCEFSTRQQGGNLLSRHLWTIWLSNVTDSVSQMSPFSINGLPSPGYQCPTTVFQPTPQQVYSLTQTGQQVQEGRAMSLTAILVFKSRNYTLFENSRKNSFCMCVRLLLVCNWWDLQQRLIQQPKFIHPTSSGSSRTRSAAEDFPQANLFVQVRQSITDNSINMNLRDHIQMNTYFIFMSAVWSPWPWRTAKQAASLSARSIALWRNIFLISRYKWNIFS